MPPRLIDLSKLVRRIVPAQRRAAARRNLQDLARRSGPRAVATLEQALASPRRDTLTQAMAAVRSFADAAKAPWLLEEVEWIAELLERPLEDAAFEQHYPPMVEPLTVLLDETRQLHDLLHNVDCVDQLLRGIDPGDGGTGWH